MSEYHTRYDGLRVVAAKLESLLEAYLIGVSHIDRIAARAKSPSSFEKKAQKVGEDGLPKYTDPLIQIQDQIGARITVYFQSDIDAVAALVERYFRPIERKNHVPESPWRFGYVGRHWVLALPDDVVPIDVDRAVVPRFFELQVKTMFQHAWSEASHDLAYKPVGSLSDEHQRRFAYSAAQAWGADREFQELLNELVPPG